MGAFLCLFRGKEGLLSTSGQESTPFLWNAIAKETEDDSPVMHLLCWREKRELT